MRKVRFLPLFLLLCLVLATAAGADVLPFVRPSLKIEVLHAPEEPLYVDLLAPAKRSEVSWGNDDRADPIVAQLKTLEQDGWLLAFTTGNRSGPVHGSREAGVDGMWHFSYMLPGTFRIAAATANAAQATEQVFELDSMHGTVVYDWETNTVVSLQSRPVYYLVQFLLALLATLGIEGLVLWRFGFREKRSWTVFCIVNVVTQLGLHALCGSAATASFLSGSPLPLLLPELVIFAVEMFAFHYYMEESTSQRRRRCALVANLCSYLGSVAFLWLLSPLLGWLLHDILL